ncbi:hypothetical protein [Salipiger sp. PrR003]|uniref:hypothetical protein n=1 Tax=Salipiger sp. PrR003 TaxID=2706776 RepID=UPI0013DCF5C3|nr:hypothetical protein [Salipiger sp. PrR003]NDV50188.1 hypothetical protein [Salipiger sp. PrR003]
MSIFRVCTLLEFLTTISGCGALDRLHLPGQERDPIEQPRAGGLAELYDHATDGPGPYIAQDWANPKFNTPRYEPNNLNADKAGAVPGVFHRGEMWTDPDTQCVYSRTGRRTETAWSLVINPPGKPKADPSCQRYFVTVPYSGEHKWKRTGKHSWECI